ncbi:hypothetical protein Dda_3251 [Drechslerella dactyloides]|uniref:Uncharacterized protein n=1 Tax=Drechslerella dactyloides TaxID=74499 RepID=A0AAD6J132_DREDA|nr:hypothetical protein Dda_3251 [Drechslerella dactyloides]
MPSKFKKAIAKLFGKKSSRSEHIYSKMTMIIAPLTANLALMELPPSEDAMSTLPSSNDEQTMESIEPRVISPAFSMPEYDQEGLTRIDCVPRPAWAPSLSCTQMAQTEMHKKCHYRYAKLSKHGIHAPTMPVGPKRLAALEAYEKLDAQAPPIGHPLPQFTGVAAGLEESPLREATIKTKTILQAHGPNSLTYHGKMIRKKLMKTNKPAVTNHKVLSLYPGLPSVQHPAGRTARGWGREGVKPGLQPRATSPHLYGRDRQQSKQPLRQLSSPPTINIGITSETETDKERIRYREFRRDT